MPKTADGNASSLRREIEKLCWRGYDNGVALVSLNAVLALVDVFEDSADDQSELRCKCGGETHPDEAACIHCGAMKPWAA